jgi:hypothetical protein
MRSTSHWSLAAALLVLAGCVADVALGAGPTRLPRFADYPVREIYRGKTARPRGLPSKGMDKAGLREAAKAKANFAGRWVIAIGSCGTGCRSIAAIDAKTGIVCYLGHSLLLRPGDLRREVEFRLKSRLMILRGARDENERDFGTHYYVLVKGKFVHLRTMLDGPPAGFKRNALLKP